MTQIILTKPSYGVQEVVKCLNKPYNTIYSQMRRKGILTKADGKTAISRDALIQMIKKHRPETIVRAEDFGDAEIY